LQEDGAADFTSNISLRVSIYSNTDSNLSISNIGQELSPGGISVVLPADILLKKLARRLKTKAEKRVELSYYIYALINKEKGCL
jgi:hypothetical protein